MNKNPNPINRRWQEIKILCDTKFKTEFDNIGTERCDNLLDVLKAINDKFEQLIVNVGGQEEIVKGWNDETKEWELRTLVGCDSIDVDTEGDTIKICINGEWFESQLDPIRQSIIDLEIALDNAITNLTNLIYETDQNLRDELCCLIEECEPDYQVVPELTGCSTSTSEYNEWVEGSVKDGYYIITREDVNEKSCHFGEQIIERVPSRDGECEGVGEPPIWTQIDGVICDGLEAYHRLKDTNLESKSYGQIKKGDRWAAMDSECEPDPLPPLDPRGCAFCNKVEVTIGAGASSTLSEWSISPTPPSPLVFDEESGCIFAPNYSSTPIDYTGTITCIVNITDPLSNGWEIKVDGVKVKTGSGDYTGEVNDNARVYFRQRLFLEGTYYTC